MGQVRITLNGRGYDIACDDGQEEHVMRLANAMSERVNQLVAANGQVGEARLLLMAGLLLADDLHSVRAKAAAQSLRQAPPKPVKATPTRPTPFSRLTSTWPMSSSSSASASKPWPITSKATALTPDRIPRRLRSCGFRGQPASLNQFSTTEIE